MIKGTGLLTTLVATLVFGAACKVHQTEAPTPTGPSEFAHALRMTITPDSISQDGASQASILMTALGPNGQPESGVAIRMDIRVGGVLQDFGTLSARTVVTGNDGTTRCVYTAPGPPPANLGGSGTLVTFLATPIGNNFDASQTQSVELRLVPPGVILPPADTPIARFTVTPTPISINLPVTFDASTSCAGSSSCTTTSGITNFAWTFGDGTAAATGKTVTHTFTRSGAFQVTLTVTNDRGISASTSQTVSADALALPTVDFTFSPGTPSVNQDVFFVAQATSGVPGHSITRYDWNFGTGSTGQGQTVTKSYDQAGIYSVQLTVTDDLGSQRVAIHSVTVGTIAGGGLTAAFTFSPTTPTVGQTVFFNAASSSGNPVRYDYDFGDGVTASGSLPTQTHAFTAAAIFVVRLTIVDAAGRTNAITQNVTVSSSGGGSPTAPTAVFTFSPAAPGVGENVFFNASSSTPGPGHSIVTYAWTFGDGTVGGGVTVSHMYVTAGTFSVQLRTTDEIGQSTTSSVTTIAIGSPPAPTAHFTFSPTDPFAGDQVVFDASGTITTQGTTIVDVAWNYGDGTAVVHCGTLFGNDPSCVNVPFTNRISAHTFASAATFQVNLVVTDSAGRTGQTFQSVKVLSPNPTARLTLVKGGLNNITADGSASTATGSFNIAIYTFNFGDGTPIVSGAAAVVPHTFPAPGTYVVTLTVTDNHVPSRSGSVTASVTVP